MRVQRLSRRLLLEISRFIWVASIGVLAGSCATPSPAPPAASAPVPAPIRPVFRLVPGDKYFTQPRVLHSVAPKLSRQAVDGGIEGMVLVKCVVTVEGTLENCRIIRGLPTMDDAVLAVLPSWRYTPATYRGEPVNLDLIIPIDLRWKNGPGGKEPSPR